MTESGRPQLEYGSVPPWHRRRSSRRVVALCFGLIVLSFCLRWGNIFVERVKARYWFGQCMTYQAPKGTVGLEPHSNGWAVWTPEPWTKFCLHWSGSAPMTAGTLFLHERKTRTGASRLVAVDVVGFTGRGTVQVQSWVFAPPVSIAPARCKLAVFGVLGMPGDAMNLRIYAGEPDAEDSSHFVMKYEAGAKSGLIDGWLRDDETVVLELRDDAAATTRPDTTSRGAPR